MMIQKLAAMLVSLVLMCSYVFADQAEQKKPNDKKPATGLRLRLELADDHVWPAKSIRLRLTLENLGDVPIPVINPCGYWCGGAILIEGPDGQYGFISPPFVPAPLTDNDFMVLVPGESRGQLIDIGSAQKIEKNGAKPQPPVYLHERKGTYSVTGFYSVKESSSSALTRPDIVDQELHSNTVKFTVEKAK